MTDTSLSASRSAGARLDLLPWYAGLTGAALLAAAGLVLFYAPVEAVQGPVQKLFYLHVPAAIACYACFGVVLVSGVAFLWTESPRAGRLGRVAAEVGLLFTTVALVMGSIWAKPIWGAYWVWWDARLVATLVLWLMLAAYLLVHRIATPGRQAGRFAAVVGIVGSIDVPVVHYSVDWWRTQHPQSVLAAAGGPALPAAMLLTFLVSLLAVLLLAGLLIWLRYRLEAAREALADLVAEAG